MNGMRVLSVKSAVSENRVQYSFLSDRSLSNISISYIYIYQLYISYHMNSVRVLSVKSAVSGDRVQCSFLSDRSLSNISISYIYIYINYIYLIIWTVCVFCQWRVLLVKTEFSVHFLLTGAYQNISISYIYISYHMNGMRVLSVKSAVSGDWVQCSFLSDRSLSKHLYILYISIIYILSYERCGVLSVKSAVSENRVQYSFLTDRSLSKHLYILYIYISIIYILSYERYACFVSEECC